MYKHPLISCICITDNRPMLLKRAIDCYLSQNYIRKELVISYPKDDVNTKDFVKMYLRDKINDIELIERDPDVTLGNARNHAIFQCHGDYICIWDDDDWHHPSRLSFQYNSLETTGNHFLGSVLTRIFLFDETSTLGYLSFPYHWDGTLFCKKEMVLQNQYANRNKGEDTHVVPFLNSRGMLAHINEAPFLYIYVYHGSNTWDYTHFKIFIEKSSLLKPGYISKISKQLDIGS
jgi:glycosyltransferase involved in cell wall biosynthesis